MRLHVGVYREGALFYFSTKRRKFQHMDTVDSLINLFLSDIAAFVVT